MSPSRSVLSPIRSPSNLTLGSSMNGACVMFSVPPATAISTSPVRISWAAMLMASRPDEHCRLTAIVGVSSGMPALSEDSRAAYPASWAWSAFPITTSSTASGDTPARSSAALIAVAPSLGAATSLNEPPNLPIGVLAPLTITAFCISFLLTGFSGSLGDYTIFQECVERTNGRGGSRTSLQGIERANHVAK